MLSRKAGRRGRRYPPEIQQQKNRRSQIDAGAMHAHIPHMTAVPAQQAPQRCPFDDTKLRLHSRNDGAVKRVSCRSCGYAAHPERDGLWHREDPGALPFWQWVVAASFGIALAAAIAIMHTRLGWP